MKAMNPGAQARRGGGVSVVCLHLDFKAHVPVVEFMATTTMSLFTLWLLGISY